MTDDASGWGASRHPGSPPEQSSWGQSAPPPPWGGQWGGQVPPSQADWAQPPRRGGNRLSIIGIVAGLLGLLILPIVLGPLGIVLGIIATTKKQRLGVWAIAAGVVGLVGGIILGLIVLGSLNR